MDISTNIYKIPNKKKNLKNNNTTDNSLVNHLLYSESKKDDFPNSNSPDFSFLKNYIKYKLAQNKLDLDKKSYDIYNFS